MAEQSKTERLLTLIASAYPKLEELTTARDNLSNYLAQIETYKAAAQVEKTKIDAIMVELKSFSDRYVTIYLEDVPPAPPVEEPPAETPPTT